MGMKEYIEAGKVATTHGLKGEVKLYPWCDDPGLFLDIKIIYFEYKTTDGKRYKQVAIEGARLQKNMILLKLAQVDTIDEAGKLRDKIVFLHRDQIPLDAGEYLIQDLIGITVEDIDTGKIYGTLCDVSQTGANDVYHILFADGKERLIPVIPQVVCSTNLEDKKMLIRPLKGLFDDED